ncbi:hypothetical protein UFOVP1090_23 [uncultured Caudovirales phage]|uniref:Holin n=1 Tax=uncultured Caudovirales phage TaxID=2100421 RepID=A0A6J5QEB8_9CAUD|nr:hypothetical protein UFOVP1090_23 [uncultured Caudovirales phage]
MNSSIINGILRAIVPAIITYAAAKGFDLSQFGSEAVIGGVAAIIAAIWSVTSKKAPNNESPGK